MYAIDFTYAEETLSDHGFMICTIGSSSGTETVSSGSDITFDTVKAPNSNEFSFIDSKYENVYSTTYQICKNQDQSDNYVNSYEESALQRWLSRKEPHKFKVDQPEFYDSYFMGSFSIKKVEITGRGAGFELTFYANAPFAYKEFEEIEATITESNNTLSIYDISDEIGILCPNMTITLAEDGDLTISNSMDNRTLILNGCVSGEVITLDSKAEMPSSSVRTNAQLGANGVFNFYYQRVINTYEEQENVYTFSLPCNVIFNYKPIKKVGL